MNEFLALAFFALIAAHGGRVLEIRKHRSGWPQMVPGWGWLVLTVAWSFALGSLAYWGLRLWLEWSVATLTK